jgi:hypothetical protein
MINFKEAVQLAIDNNACESALLDLKTCENWNDFFNLEKSPQYSYWYAREVLKSRFELGEKAISNNSEYSYLYAREVLKSRFELGEKAISADAWYSYLYAVDFLKTSGCSMF